ncbi:MAG: hypothetical protein KF844_06460 [Cryobacterium sp.]|nr:hypothetical protein [Cryobacterium sp.]
MATEKDLSRALRDFSESGPIDTKSVVTRIRRRRTVKLAGIYGSSVLAVAAFGIVALPSLNQFLPSSLLKEASQAGGQAPQAQDTLANSPQGGTENSQTTLRNATCGSTIQLRQLLEQVNTLSISSSQASPSSEGHLVVTFKVSNTQATDLNLSVLAMPLPIVDETGVVEAQLQPISKSEIHIEIAGNSTSDLSVEFSVSECSANSSVAEKSNFIPGLQLVASTPVVEQTFVFGELGTIPTP